MLSGSFYLKFGSIIINIFFCEEFKFCIIPMIKSVKLESIFLYNIKFNKF